MCSTHSAASRNDGSHLILVQDVTVLLILCQILNCKCAQHNLLQPVCREKTPCTSFSRGSSRLSVLQVELAAKGGRISELEQGAVSMDQFEELQKDLQDQRLETRLAQTRCEELQQHCEELVCACAHAHACMSMQTFVTTFRQDTS